MARVEITVPDELLTRARAHGLDVSALAIGAVSEELDRRARVAALHEHLAELEAGAGPVASAEAMAAKTWADDLQDQLGGSLDGHWTG